MTARPRRPAHICFITAVARETEAVSDGLSAAGATPGEPFPDVGLVAFEPEPAFALAPDIRCSVRTAGVGRVNAAIMATRLLAGPDAPDLLVSAGVAGTLTAAVPVGAFILATESVYADEGLLGPDGFITTDAMGFPLGPFDGNRIPGDAAYADRVHTMAVHLASRSAGAPADTPAPPIHRGPVATVATCSGTDTGARTVATRTDAMAEAMEGAGVLHVAAVHRIPGLEIRGISNTTGDRPAQRWDLEAGLDALTFGARAVGAAFSDPSAQTAPTP